MRRSLPTRRPHDGLPQALSWDLSNANLIAKHVFQWTSIRFSLFGMFLLGILSKFLSLAFSRARNQRVCSISEQTRQFCTTGITLVSDRCQLPEGGCIVEQVMQSCQLSRKSEQLTHPPSTKPYAVYPTTRLLRVGGGTQPGTRRADAVVMLDQPSCCASLFFRRKRTRRHPHI